MTDAPISSTVQGRPEKPADSGSQAFIAFTIVICLTLLGAGCLAVAVEIGNLAAEAFTIVGTIAGGLINALAAPSGIGSVIAQAVKKPDAAG